MLLTRFETLEKSFAKNAETATRKPEFYVSNNNYTFKSTASVAAGKNKTTSTASMTENAKYTTTSTRCKNISMAQLMMGDQYGRSMSMFDMPKVESVCYTTDYNFNK